MRGVPKHSRGWTSIARSLEEGESRPIDDRDENIEITLGIRIKDRDPRIAAMALNSANLAVFNSAVEIEQSIFDFEFILLPCNPRPLRVRLSS